jgi:hypothetical protein
MFILALDTGPHRHSYPSHSPDGGVQTCFVVLIHSISVQKLLLVGFLASGMLLRRRATIHSHSSRREGVDVSVARRALPAPARRADVSKRLTTSRRSSEGCYATTGPEKIVAHGRLRPGPCLAETGFVGGCPKPRSSVTVSATQRTISTAQLYSYNLFTILHDWFPWPAMDILL